VTSFRFDDALRAAITDRLGRFELRRRVDAGGLKRAAVAVVVVEADVPGEAAFLLTKRTPKLRAHGGQWALPGGRVDAGETIEQTALRELHEELGVLAGADDILGTLDDYPTRSGYLIAPVVVWSAGVTVTPNPSEVAAAYRIACGELFREGSPEIIAIEESDRPIIRPRHPRRPFRAAGVRLAVNTVMAEKLAKTARSSWPPARGGASGTPSSPAPSPARRAD